ncbi:uncharacterized protein LAJ45_02937 [Morchella importuna]|uniref:uncharacterized protein n=1 Tax=Morchella importuna TaxID=1174673 RepID=UPI001E8E6330|nr:uncharacterized protein LAJ45_02937 [Morchella importuna]KAH8152713.1 hypothetical protein LAJ45_02937 [Morchella importuna]
MHIYRPICAGSRTMSQTTETVSLSLLGCRYTFNMNTSTRGSTRTIWESFLLCLPGFSGTFWTGFELKIGCVGEEVRVLGLSLQLFSHPNYLLPVMI